MIRSPRTVTRLVALGRAFARNDALFLLTERPLADLPMARLAALVLRIGFGRGAADGRARRKGERLARALTDMGPSFIKLGQGLSTRSDLLGREVAADLAGLQDRLPAFPGDVARAIVERELERPIEAVFAQFDLVPVAAGSIAQVHFAETTEGERVAVKVLRPGVEASFAADIDLFRSLARAIDTVVPDARRLRLPEVVETFAESVRLEMDLRLEAAACAEFAENLRDLPSFRVPRVDWMRTARRVLTLERVTGIPVGDSAALAAAGIDRRALLTTSATSFFLQVFRDGYFHADLHPGNLFVDLPGTLVPVDFGIMGRLDLKSRRYLAEMLMGFVTGDYRRVAEVHFRAGYVPATKSLESFTQACRSIGEPIRGLPLAEISVARLLAQMFEVTELFDMETQPQLLLLQKTMMQAEGMGRLLDAEVNMWQLARPLVEEWMIANLGPQARLADFARDTVAGLERLPQVVVEVDRTMQRLGSRGLRLDPASLAHLPRSGSATSWAWLLAVVAAFLLGLAL